jgi:hypothetical protein
MLQYIGKDKVTQGSMLILNRQQALKLLRSRAKQGFRKAQRAGVTMEENRDLALMAEVWYDPATLPESLSKDQRMFVARINGDLAGAIIVTPISPNTLFYHFGGSSELGRQHEVNAYMFWHIVESFENSQYQFLDVGVSYRNELQHYFQKYCTHPYPIIFRPPPPGVLPRMSQHPFHTGNLHWDAGPMMPINTQLYEFLGADFTYMPDAEFAILSGLKALDVKQNDTVLIVSSFPESTPAPAILKTLDGFCKWTYDQRKDTKAVIVNHRFGFPYQQIDNFEKLRQPILEISLDCLNLTIGSQKVGTLGDLSVFDFTRIFPMQYGAVLVGEHFDDKHIWDNFGCLDVDKRNQTREQLGIFWEQQPEIHQHRMNLWGEYLKLFQQVGMEPQLQLDENSIPSAFVFRTLPQYPPIVIQERLLSFGVTVEIDPEVGWVALPCHQNISPAHRDYIFGVYRGMMNPCVSFVRPPSGVDPSADKRR